MKSREKIPKELTLVEVLKQFPNDADLLQIVKTGKEKVLIIDLCGKEIHTPPSKKEILFYACRETGALK